MATFVLIHGSWHAGWCWHKIVNRLEAKGHTVFAPDLPAHGRSWGAHKDIGLKDYVNAVCADIDRANEPVVVVAHSRGGIVASQVAEARPDKIAACVYLAAYLIPNGKRVLEYALTDKDSVVVRNLDVDRERGADMLRQEAFREGLYHDCDEDDVALAHLLLSPEPIMPAATPLKLSDENYGRVPRFYIELTEDRAISLPLQRRMHGAIPCERVMSIDASHSAYFSKPDELTDCILSVAA
jgi:pimeloyl-ACP methyl ester carboxylesterase